MNVSIDRGLGESYVAPTAGFRRAASAAALALAVVAAPAAAAEAADLLFVGGAVYTVDAARSWASAVAVRGGRIVYVGDDASARAFAGPSTRIVELDGKMLLPGFHDSHVHLASGGHELLLCDLNDSKSAAEVIARIERCAAERPGDDWLRGGGWELPLFPGGNPHKSVLDRIAPGRPVYMESSDGHTTWVNSRALALAGITAATPDPPNGRIERDPATGEPTGTLRETAGDLVEALLPDPTPEEIRRGLELGIARAHRYGVVGALEATAHRARLEALRDLDRAGKLGLHVTAALRVDPNRGPEQVAELAQLRDADWGPNVRASAAKLYVDGVLEAQTGALYEPYVGRGGDRGDLIWSEARLGAIAVALDRAGLQIHVHAIGDRAIGVTFDALEEVAKLNGPRDRRPALTHIQLFAPGDVERFRALGAAASFQPLWAYEDTFITELTVPFLGPERSARLYPIGSVLRAGGVVAGGSDWSVSTIDPLPAIEVAITRRAPDAEPGPAWLPDERADLPSMLAAYTIGSAWASFRERESGSIEVGKRADLVVLDRNLFAIPVTAISDAKVLLTLFGGEAVYRDPSFEVPHD